MGLPSVNFLVKAPWGSRRTCQQGKKKKKKQCSRTTFVLYAELRSSSCHVVNLTTSLPCADDRRSPQAAAPLQADHRSYPRVRRVLELRLLVRNVPLGVVLVEREVPILVTCNGGASPAHLARLPIEVRSGSTDLRCFSGVYMYSKPGARPVLDSP